MASKKSFPFGPDDMASGAVPLSDAVKESAQQIWLAGLGAFSKAQAEGGKVFEALVKEGVNMQRKTQTVAEEKITEAAQRMTSAATEMGSRAAGQWDKLETIFEDRVAKALGRLGIPTARDLQALNERIDALTSNHHISRFETSSNADDCSSVGSARPHGILASFSFAVVHRDVRP